MISESVGTFQKRDWENPGSKCYKWNNLQCSVSQAYLITCNNNVEQSHNYIYLQKGSKDLKLQFQGISLVLKESGITFVHMHLFCWLALHIWQGNLRWPGCKFLVLEQDHGLEALSHVISRQKAMAVDIGNELDSQNGKSNQLLHFMI